MKDDRLAGRRALVTGGGRRGGIGRASALALAGAGADVFVADFDRPAETAEIIDAIRALGRRAESIQCDLRSVDACKRTVRACVAALAGIDALLHNAVFAQPIFKEEPIEADWDAA